MRKKIVVTGASGYIGSAIVLELCRKENYEVFSLDKEKSSFSQFILCDITNKKKLERIFLEHRFDCVIHCAAKKAVGESEEMPFSYFKHNILGTINILEAMEKSGCKKIIFSSTACVYKQKKGGVFVESDTLEAPNIYGFTKIQAEQLIQQIARTKKMKYVIFRYFNVAGDCGLKYKEKKSQNLFPQLSQNIKDNKVSLVFGNTYPTKDGTCVRDYIHLDDLVKAHIKAVSYRKNEVFNLGTKKGTSVLQIVKEFEKQLKRKISYKIDKKRKGDVAVSLADSKKAEEMLKWKAKKDVKKIVGDYIRVYGLK